MQNRQQSDYDENETKLYDCTVALQLLLHGLVGNTVRSILLNWEVLKMNFFKHERMNIKLTATILYFSYDNFCFIASLQ